MTAVIVGASGGLGRALAAELAGAGRDLLLVSSDGRDVAAIAADLGLRFGISAAALDCDARDLDRLAGAFRREAAAPRAIESVLLPIGAVDDADDPLLETERALQLFQTNFLAVHTVLRELAPRLVAQGHGSVVGFGSIAAARGRSRNAIYAAAKRALASYFESLRHHLEPAGVSVAFYTLGYLDTRLAYGRRLRLPKADPGRVARRVCAELGRRRGNAFLPGYWYLVDILMRSLPWALFRRLKF